MTLLRDALKSLNIGRATRAYEGWGLPRIGAGQIELVADLRMSYEQMYHSQPWVYSAVNKIARSTGMMPLKPYQRGEGRDREQLYDGDLRRLIREPVVGLTSSYWKQHIIGSTLLYGNGIVVKLGAKDAGDIPDELMPAPSVGWAKGENDTYVWTSERGERYAFPRWQIMHFRHWDTTSDGFGVSALEPLRRALAIEDAATRLGVAAFKNAARPGSVIQSDEKLDQDVIARLRANIESLYGNVDNAFRIAVLEQGLKWNELTHNLDDITVVDHRKITREEVAAVFDIPQPAIGILDEANFASVNELHQMFYTDTIGPWIRMIEETIQVDLIDPIAAFDGQFVEFDLGMILRGNMERRSVAYQRLISSGVYTPNEVRAMENMPPSEQPEADLLHFPMNLSPNAAVAGASDQPDEGDEQ